MTIARSVDFLNRMVKPDFERFTRDPVNTHSAYHLAVSLWSLKDWVWKEHGKHWKSKQAYEDELHKRCASLRFIRDVANSVKHLELDQPKTIRGISDVGMSGGSGLLGFGAISGGAISSAPELSVQTLKHGNRIFAVEAKAVFDMWEKLFNEKGWN